MRAAGLSVVVVLASCGGGTHRPSAQPIGHVAEHRVDGWTLPRALATLPGDTDVLFVWDSARVRRSQLVGPYWHQLADLGQRIGGGLPYREVCPQLVDTDATMVMAMQLRSLSDFSASIWAIGLPSHEYRDCLVKAAALKPDAMTVEVEGDLMRLTVTQPRPMQSTALLVDDSTVLIRVGPYVDLAAMRALLAPVAQPMASPELAWLLADDPEAWLVARASSGGVLGSFAGTFVDGGAAFHVTDRLAVEVRARMATAADAQGVADKVGPMLDQAVAAAFLDEGAASATDTVASVTVALEKESILRLVHLISAQLGGFGGVPIAVPPGPPAGP